MKRLPKNRVPITVSIPLDFLAEIDEIVYERSISRSDYVVQALKEKVERDKK